RSAQTGRRQRIASRGLHQPRGVPPQRRRGSISLRQISWRCVGPRQARSPNQVFTLGHFADFSSYFFPLFSTLLQGTSRTGLRTTRLRTICLRGSVAASVSPGNDRAFNRTSADATILRAPDGRRFIPRGVNEFWGSVIHAHA